MVGSAEGDGDDVLDLEECGAITSRPLTAMSTMAPDLLIHRSSDPAAPFLIPNRDPGAPCVVMAA